MAFLAIGLGNPGEKYTFTRHNAGFWVVKALAKQLDVTFKKPRFKRYKLAKGISQGNSIYLAMPLTFMNRSGEIIADLLKRTETTLDEVLVICDSLDLSPGYIRLKTKGSSGGHNGLDSIIRITGTRDIMRLMIGIGRPAARDQVINYVLNRPGSQDKLLIDEAVEKAAQGILRLLSEEPQKVMNELNRKQSGITL